jgi:hypothetical protein
LLQLGLVHGLAIGNDLQPVPGAEVRLTSGSFTAVATTDAAGAFTVASVPTPYDAMLVVTDLAEVTLYQGLGRADPTLVSLGSSVAVHPGATVGGTLSGGASLPLPANYRTRVTFGSPEGGGVASASGATGSYQVMPTWWGPATTTGSLYALQWQYDAAGLPIAYTGFASRSGVTLVDGDDLAGQDLSLAAVASGQLSGTLLPPAGYVPVLRRLLVVFGANQALDLARETSSDPGFGPTFDYLTPAPPSASLLLTAVATSATASTTVYAPLATSATGVDVTLPAAAALVSPADGAVGVSFGTTFGWTPTPGGISLLVVRGPSTFVTVTASSSATLPDTAALGVPLPPSTDFDWYVFGVGPFADIDAAAGRGGYLGPFVEPESNVFQTESASRSLTTAP